MDLLDAEIMHITQDLAPFAAGMMSSLVLDYPPIEMVLRVVNRNCWRCGTEAPAFGLVHVQDCTCSEDVIYTTDSIEMEYAKDLLIAAGSLLAKTIKVRHSRTRGGGAPMWCVKRRW